MKAIKRLMAACLLPAMMLGLLSGCGGAGAEDGTLTVLGRTGSNLDKVLQEQFPDIPFEFVYYDGWNTSSELKLRESNCDIPDIYVGTMAMEDGAAKENLLDLSGYSFCDNFEPSILNDFDVDGCIYQLPGPVTIRSIIYNKTLFEEYGWQEPQTFGELVALCRQIREEADGVTPIVFGGAANGYYFTTMTTYSQAEFLYTLDGKELEKKYLAGEAGAEEVFGTGIQMTQELIDAGAFDVAQNEGYWDAAIFQERIVTGQAAMQFAWGAQSKLFALVNENPDLYGVIPFRNRAGEAVLGTGVNGNLGLAKRLGEPGNEKKLENALRVIEWISTEEGQEKAFSASGSVIHPIKDAVNEKAIPQLRELWYSNLDGIKAPMLYAGYEDIIVPAADYIVEAIQGQHDLSGLAALIDEAHQAFLAQDTDNDLTYAGTFATDFTHEETAQMVTNMIHEMGSSDITMVSEGQRINGVVNRMGSHAKFYEGPLLHDWVTVYVPGEYESAKSAIVQMHLTGSQIQELLENGKNVVMIEAGATNGEALAVTPEDAYASAAFPYYWAGMAVEMKNGKVTSMALDDGTPVEQDKTYTVSFAYGDYTDAVAAAGEPVELGFSAVDAITAYLKEHSPLSPAEVLRKN